MFVLHRSTHDTIRRIGLALALIGWMGWTALPSYSQNEPGSSSLTQAGLTLEPRINYQRAIEEVYWRHRIWPKQNAAPKPALDEVMPLSTLRAKVEDYLRKSQALEVYWKRPITGEQLQAEMDRMARQTKQPAVLKELWAALGNDPYVIAECLARPSLASRLIRNWYRHDERYHGELKARAEADLPTYGTASQMRAMSGEYREVEWVKEERRRSQAVVTNRVTLSSEQWVERVRELAQLFSGPHSQPLSRRGGRGESLFGLTPLSTSGGEGGPQGPGEGARAELDALPLGELSTLQEDDDRFYVTAVLDKTADQVKLATVEWKKQPFDAWWKGQAAALDTSPNANSISLGALLAAPEQDATYEYRLPTISSGPATCVNDTWASTLVPYVSARSKHTAVWTGSEMIVWGGTVGFPTTVNTGGRYDPATDTWTAVRPPFSGRFGHSAVWTGSEMIVWGGFDYDSYFNIGARYDPARDSWRATATANSPEGRANHTAVWTGNEMIVWGGVNCPPFDPFHCFRLFTGGRYNPATDSWTATSTTNVPSPREQHTAVWTGSEMIVWGGVNGDLYLRSGGRYDPVTDSWVATARDTAPSARIGHTAVWTGTQMIVWGGFGGDFIDLNTGGRYDPATDSWTATATQSAPSARHDHTAVWAESKMVVWGGSIDNTGGRYDPATDTWTATSAINAPSPRSGHTAVWTGSEMIVWGGSIDDTGGRYDPVTDSWTATTATNVPSPREQHTAVWTGSEMIIWGGSGSTGYQDIGGRYDPATDTWTPTSTQNPPLAGIGHTAVWTGSEMIVWGGGSSTGGRYDPTTDTWTATATDNAPTGRYLHTAVWTGIEMIVWGGIRHFQPYGEDFLNTGGRYNPETDSWTPTEREFAPSARSEHTAVWAGSKMIVWGGVFNDGVLHLFNTGGRYDPATDSWTATTATNAPSPRFVHTAVWTGREMIIWGGADSGGLNTGGSYDPATDTWTATTTTNAPSGRWWYTAVWTGSEMIVWGGAIHLALVNTGGRYDPAADSWTVTATTNVPSPRYRHTAVWTGSEMIVWGGSTTLYVEFVPLDTGGRYCASVGTFVIPSPFP